MRRGSFQLLFWLCLAVVFGVMGWLCSSLWNLENRRVEELSRNRLEELTRLALWRMDSVLASYWVEENGRAPQEYFFLTEKNTEKRSPLFSRTPGYARLYFQIDVLGKVSSPQIPEKQGNGSKEGNVESLQRDFHFLTQPGLAALLREAAIKASFIAGGKNAEPLPASLGVISYQGRVLASGRRPAKSESVCEIFSLEKTGKKKGSGEALTENSLLKGSVNSLTASGKLVSARQLAQQQQSEIDYGIRTQFNNTLSQNIAPRQELSSDNSPFEGCNRYMGAAQSIAAVESDEPTLGDSFSQPLNGKPIAKNSRALTASLKSKKKTKPLEVDKVASSSPSKSLSKKEVTQMDTGLVQDLDFGEWALPSASKLSLIKRKQKEKEVSSMTIADMPLAVSPFSPRWINGHLFLLRTVSNENQKYVQGIWLDWEKIRKALLTSISDFLPNANLSPLPGGEVTRNNVTRVLTGLPLLIDPGDLPQQVVSEMRPMREALLVACGFALAAAVVAAFLLRAVMKLSERRATFVSAVTHELRTPLTTFNLYTEMLTEGLVPEKKMSSYFATLRQEALRLTHLVDNVLSFSRLEKSRPGRHPECISLENLKETVWKHIAPRLENSGMTVEVLLNAGDAQKEICTDVTAVEQIMYNLADNAAKYAAVKGAVVIWEILPRGRSLTLRFRDRGPGIPESLRKKLFRPFSRSAEEAAGRKPGVGLGLALSREIARDLGGELNWEPGLEDGACFVLILPWKTGKKTE